MGKRKNKQVHNTKEEGLELRGTVTGMPGGGFYIVETEVGTTVKAKLSGKMKKYKIRVVVGDKVTVEVSPYDTGMGRIVVRDR